MRWTIAPLASQGSDLVARPRTAGQSGDAALGRSARWHRARIYYGRGISCISDCPLALGAARPDMGGAE